MHQEFIWVRLKLSISCFSLWTSYYFIIEWIDTFYLVNNVVVYKALLMKEKGSKIVYKIFIVNVVSVHLSATWQFWPFERPWTGISWGAYYWATLEDGGGYPKWGKKSRGGGLKSVRTPCVDWFCFFNKNGLW